MSSFTAISFAADKMETDDVGTADKKPAVEAEPCSYTLENPARVVFGQARFVVLTSNGRWKPVKRESPVGILVMHDMQPGDPQELVSAQGDAAVAPAGPSSPRTAAAPAAPAAPAGSDIDDEPPPPAPFTYQP